MSVTVTNANNRRNKKLAFKNNAPFRSFISKINDTSIVNAEDLDIAMPMYKLLEYSENNSMTSGSLWNYYRDEINDAIINKCLCYHRWYIIIIVIVTVIKNNNNNK